MKTLMVIILVVFSCLRGVLSLNERNLSNLVSDFLKLTDIQFELICNLSFFVSDFYLVNTVKLNNCGYMGEI